MDELWREFLEIARGHYTVVVPAQAESREQNRSRTPHQRRVDKREDNDSAQMRPGGFERPCDGEATCYEEYARQQRHCQIVTGRLFDRSLGPLGRLVSSNPIEATVHDIQ